MSTPTIAFLCGSLREGSINQKLQQAMIARFKEAGADCKVLDLGEYDLPLYHGDLDMPDGATALAKDMETADGVMVISPEYNGGLPPLLKNAIDWVSTTGLNAFRAPYFGIASCTPGPMSGIMCMRQINYILMRLGAHVSPTQVGVGLAAQAFTVDGKLVKGRSADLADTLIADMLDRISRNAG
jgi:NAD(P)H-dependent FMN reductase